MAYTPLQSSGYQHLDGIQTLAYCRIRYTAGYDFKRTERQREVLTKIFDKAKSQGVTTLLSLADTMLPSVRALSGELRISALTVKKAYDKLEEEGFVVTVHGKGTFVAAADRQLASEAIRKSIEDEFSKVIEKAKLNGLSPDEIREICEIIMEE